MKLDRSTGRKKRGPERAINLLTEERVDESWFDPLKEVSLPELAALAQTPELPHDQKMKVVSSAWLGALDKGYAEALRSSPWLKEFWKSYCLQYFRPGETKPDFSSLKSTCNQFAKFLEIFPEERANLPISQEHLQVLLQGFNGSDLGEQLVLGVQLSRVFPEEQARIAKKVYRFQFEPKDYFDSALYYLPAQAEGQWASAEPSVKVFLWRMAYALVLFPEMREQYTKRVQDVSEELRQECLNKPPERSFGSDPQELYFERLFQLTILAAQDARIDSTGRLQISLKSKKLQHNSLLPDRGEV